MFERRFGVGVGRTTRGWVGRAARCWCWKGDLVLVLGGRPGVGIERTTCWCWTDDQARRWKDDPGVSAGSWCWVGDRVGVGRTTRCCWAGDGVLVLDGRRSLVLGGRPGVGVGRRDQVLVLEDGQVLVLERRPGAVEGRSGVGVVCDRAGAGLVTRC